MIMDESPRNPALPVGKLLSVIKQKRLIVSSLLDAVPVHRARHGQPSQHGDQKHWRDCRGAFRVLSALFTLGGNVSSLFCRLEDRAEAGPVKLSMTGLWSAGDLPPGAAAPSHHLGHGNPALSAGCGGTSTFSIIMSDAIAEVPNEQRPRPWALPVGLFHRHHGRTLADGHNDRSPGP